MKLRNIPSSVMYEVLRKGVINREPERNQEHGNLECRMEHYCAGINVGVAVALCDEDPELVVVTVVNMR